MTLLTGLSNLFKKDVHAIQGAGNTAARFLSPGLAQAQDGAVAAQRAADQTEIRQATSYPRQQLMAQLPDNYQQPAPQPNQGLGVTTLGYQPNLQVNPGYNQFSPGAGVDPTSALQDMVGYGGADIPQGNYQGLQTGAYAPRFVQPQKRKQLQSSPRYHDIYQDR